jgi:hypothetical protein
MRTCPRLPGWRLASGLLAAVFVVIAPIATAQAATSVPLGTDSSFAVLATSAISNTGPTTIVGNVGLDPNPASSITGFPPGTVTGGAVYAADSVALQAQTDLTTAYNNAASQPTTTGVTAPLGGATALTPGVYTSATSLSLPGTLTLDGQGNPDAVFIFKAGNTITAAAASSVVLTNGASACNVFWESGAATTIDAGSEFVGTIMSATSITMITGATLDGRALAANGGVTLDTNQITTPTCASPPAIPTTPVATMPVASAPSATDASAITVAGKAVTVTLHGSDSTGAALSYTITSGPSHGTLGTIDQADGTVVYSPRHSFSGQDSFSYQVTSSNGTSSIATVTVKVSPSAALLKARAKAKAAAKAKARAKAKAKGPSRPPIRNPAFTG